MKRERRDEKKRLFAFSLFVVVVVSVSPWFRPTSPCSSSLPFLSNEGGGLSRVCVACVRMCVGTCAV